MKIPRNEYPRPQLVRKDWLCLNGEWQFEKDLSSSGEARNLNNAEQLSETIIVPFCPESSLSGIGNTDFMNCIWYKRDILIPTEWAKQRILLHFNAVDYRSIVYINGTQVCTHSGGHVPFYCDITDALHDGNNKLTVCVYDEIRRAKQPSGKQSADYASSGCFYTRTTGIWQTVWLEPVGECYLQSLRLTPNISTPSVTAECVLCGDFMNTDIEATALWEGKAVGKVCIENNLSNSISFTIPLSEKHLWDVGVGNLYDLQLKISRNGILIDNVTSYFGLRSVCLDGRAFKINGKTVFGRWVLDQGFYPDGIYTAPSDEALKQDILNSLQLGFNGARLHEKIFEPRFLYWADKLGYLCWGEAANWGLDITDAGSIQYFVSEWMEALARDYNHPSIIGWCPFNETWDTDGRKQDDSVLRIVYEVTKAFDSTRPVIDTSGNFHVKTDIFDVHDYEQNPTDFESHYTELLDGILKDTLYWNPEMKDRQKYNGKDPTFVSEYGGIAWFEEGSSAWGYGSAPKTKEEFIARYRGLTEVLLNNPYMLGFCYTQLYDVEQEQNGLMTYDRKFKFPPKIFYDINTQVAKIEKQKD